jgi:polar amino acid transport system ATP-binding protein
MKMTADTMHVLTIDALHAAYCAVPVLNDVNLSLQPGEMACVIGPAGSGKTSLLRCIDALMPISGGSVRVAGIEVNDAQLDKPKLRRHVGLVSRPPSLFPHWTVLQNVMLPQMQILKRPRDMAEADARALLSMFQLDGCENAWPDEVSVCQQQRVAIVRALAMRPDVALFDNIAATLAPRMLRPVLLAIRQCATVGIGCIITTRDSRTICDMSDRVHALERGRIASRNVAVPQAEVAALVPA